MPRLITVVEVADGELPRVIDCGSMNQAYHLMRDLARRATTLTDEAIEVSLENSLPTRVSTREWMAIIPEITDSTGERSSTDYQENLTDNGRSRVFSEPGVAESPAIRPNAVPTADVAGAELIDITQGFEEHPDRKDSVVHFTTKVTGAVATCILLASGDLIPVYDLLRHLRFNYGVRGWNATRRNLHKQLPALASYIDYVGQPPFGRVSVARWAERLCVEFPSGFYVEGRGVEI